MNKDVSYTVKTTLDSTYWTAEPYADKTFINLFGYEIYCAPLRVNTSSSA